ncbi:MAG: T9SS type A sorting domain-containing protein [Bacteroidota bacterium]
MLKSKHAFIFCSVLLLIGAFSFINANQNSRYEELKYSRNRNPIDSSEYFTSATLCNNCHGYDTAALANIDANGHDVNVYDDWRSSMMANSAHDPFFHAKVSHEITVNPTHANAIQTQCLDCHAPLGKFTAFYHGASSYTLNDLFSDTLGLDGVSCMSCHTIGTNGLGARFSGDIPYDTTRKIFGPFTNPFAGPMQLYVGMTPTFSDHMKTSALCSSCHTLITNTIDLSGNATGGTFVEQATYHEYLNSNFASQQIYCQTCHMPQLEEPVIIANQILALTGRSPFNLHQFAGANYFMLNILKANKTYLGIQVPDAYFDSTLLYTSNNLTKNSVAISLQQDSLKSDTSYFSVTLTNKAGHKFPSGYPSRRAVLQFVVVKENGDTLFKSGIFGSNYEVNNISAPYEHHHNIIKMQTQTQIYEMVMGDVNNNKTTVLERAANLLKDNRLVPTGFTTSHYAYDTAKIDNDALADPDFNKNSSGVEGNGKDIIHFHIPSNGYSGLVSVYTKVFYQAVPPGWLQEMFSYNTPLIDTFKSMYQQADKTPVLCVSSELLNVELPNAISEIASAGNISVYPSATSDGKLSVTGESVSSIETFDAEGKLLNLLLLQNDKITTIHLPEAKGIYFIRVKSPMQTKTFKILRI